MIIECLYCNMVSEWSSWKWLEVSTRCWQIEHLLYQTDKKLSASFQPYNCWVCGSRPKLGGPAYQNTIVGALNIRRYFSHIGWRLPGAVSPDVLHNAPLRIALTVPEVGRQGEWDLLYSTMSARPKQRCSDAVIVTDSEWQPIVFYKDIMDAYVIWMSIRVLECLVKERGYTWKMCCLNAVTLITSEYLYMDSV